MLLTILFLALLLIAGLLNTLFHFPTHKIYASFLQFLFPNTNTNTNNNNSKNKSCNKASTTPTTTTSSESSSSSSSPSTLKKREELRKVFGTFDKNGDGFITRQELKESLRNLRILVTDKEIDDIVVKFDCNGDGLIDFDEFCLLTAESMGGLQDHKREREEKEIKEEEGELEEEEANLKEAFGVFDKDKDGLISVEELALVLTSLGLREGKKMQDCKEMIRKVDMDGDGMVDFHEFKRMMKAGGNLLLAS